MNEDYVPTDFKTTFLFNTSHLFPQSNDTDTIEQIENKKN